MVSFKYRALLLISLCVPITLCPAQLSPGNLKGITFALTYLGLNLGYRVSQKIGLINVLQNANRLHNQAQLAALENNAAAQNNNPPLTIFSHGLGANALHYIPYKSVFPEWLFYGFNFNDAQGLHPISNSCLAQDADINRLEQEVNKFPNHNKLLMGVSRGAATIFNYGGSCEMPSTVKGLIMESPFDHTRSVINQVLGNWFWIPGVTNMFDYFIARQVYKNYQPSGIQPIYAAHTIPLHLPILIICSKQDTLIPAASSIRLYKELLTTNHTHCYLLVTAHGSHANIIGSESRDLYINVVNAFYRNYVTNTATQEEEIYLAQFKPGLLTLDLLYNV